MSGSSSPQAYQPTGQAQADQGFQQGAGQLASAGSQLYGQASQGYGQLYGNVVSNPYAAQAQQGAGQVAALGQGVAGGQLQGAAGLQGAGNQALGLTNSVIQTGFDPQGALYNRNLASTMDSQNVANAQNGVAGSPFAAGINGQTAANFNLDWANNQQARQASAISALGSLNSTAQGDYSGASTLGNQGLSTLSSSSNAPNATYLAQQQSIEAALNALVQGTDASLAPTQQSIGDYGSYLGIGQSATGLDQTAQSNNYNQSASTASGVTQGLMALFSL
jgi:hypothetical protein